MLQLALHDHRVAAPGVVIKISNCSVRAVYTPPDGRTSVGIAVSHGTWSIAAMWVARVAATGRGSHGERCLGRAASRKGKRRSR